MKGLIGLVTGAASGLGKATVHRLQSQGVSGIIAIDRQSFPTEISTLENVHTITRCDILSENDMSNAINICREKYGKLDFLVNCAGASIAYALFNHNKGTFHRLDTFKQLINLNVVGTFNVIRHCVQLMSENTPNNDTKLRGVIVNTSSITSHGGSKGQICQSASAGAISGMTLPIARDLSSHGIRNNTIEIGYIESPLLSPLPDEVISYLGKLATSPKRIGKPEEFAHLVQTIIENPYLNGTIIRLDGGTMLPN